MTWSIVARDGTDGKFAIAIATKFFAVGALCPYVRAGVGAIASQAMVNPLYGRRGLRLLAEGVPRRTDLVIVQHPLAPPLDTNLLDALTRVHADDLSLDTPVVHAPYDLKSTIGSDRRTTFCDIFEQTNYLTPLDAGDLPVTKPRQEIAV